MGRLGALAAAVTLVAASCGGSQGPGAGLTAIGAGLNGGAYLDRPRCWASTLP